MGCCQPPTRSPATRAVRAGYFQVSTTLDMRSSAPETRYSVASSSSAWSMAVPVASSADRMASCRGMRRYQCSQPASSRVTSAVSPPSQCSSTAHRSGELWCSEEPRRLNASLCSEAAAWTSILLRPSRPCREEVGTSLRVPPREGLLDRGPALLPVSASGGAAVGLVPWSRVLTLTSVTGTPSVPLTASDPDDMVSPSSSMAPKPL
mmetsp:Transcript_17465/g.37751  ORF Transcript_17465/g.37751 Transcript_17465/m.37751 type:complete len:207 (-) Transcript_17465:1167-1787(-)